MSVVRVGAIGLGLMGTRLAEALRRHAGFELVCGSDLDEGRRAAAAGRFGLEPLADADALIARDDLDLVYVATPPASHVELGRAVLASGKALFVEKPLAVDEAQARAFVEEAEAQGARAAVNFPFATLPGLARFEECLRSGEAGAPLRLEVLLHFSQWPRTWHKAGEWLAGDVEGGFLREVFSHFAYLTQRLLEPLEIEQVRVHRAPGAKSETRVEARLTAGEVPVQLVGGAGGAAPDFNRWTLFCERRALRVEDWSRVQMSDGGRWYDLMPEAGESFGLDAQLDELAKLVRGEANALPSLRGGYEVLRVVEGLHELGCR